MKADVKQDWRDSTTGRHDAEQRRFETAMRVRSGQGDDSNPPADSFLKSVHASSNAKAAREATMRVGERDVINHMSIAVGRQFFSAIESFQYRCAFAFGYSCCVCVLI